MWSEKVSSLEEAKLKAVVEFATPRGKKDVRAFMGLAGYYHHFNRNLFPRPHQEGDPLQSRMGKPTPASPPKPGGGTGFGC